MEYEKYRRLQDQTGRDHLCERKNTTLDADCVPPQSKTDSSLLHSTTSVLLDQSTGQEMILSVQCVGLKNLDCRMKTQSLKRF